MKPLLSSEQVANACDLCGSTAVRELYTAKDRLRNTDGRFQIVECCGCSVLRTFPEMSDAELARYYPDDYWGGPEPTEKWIADSQSEKTSFVVRCGLRAGRILDVGCGSGFFLRALDPKSWDRFGVELSQAAAEAGEKALGKGHVYAGTLADAGWDNAWFDVVTFWSALEHTNAPRANLIEARRIIKPGGTLIVQLPNASSYQARFFGGDWFALDAPRHRYHFSLSTLERVLSETGFQIYQTSFISKAHNSHALRQSLKTRLFGGDSSGPKRLLFYLSIPLIKPFDWILSVRGKGATLTIAARAV
jgi:SAM-dependent methyltransferase